jgi:hypothetical protein
MTQSMFSKTTLQLPRILMLFWTPDITSHFCNWLNSTTEQVLCCELSPWNGISSSEFEGRLSSDSSRSCVCLNVNGEHINGIIDTIWRHAASNEKAVEAFLNKIGKYHSDELKKQINSGSQPDLGIYDCVDLLSKFEGDTLLCIRVSDAVSNYLMSWVEYIISTTGIKILFLPKKICRISQFNGLNRIVLPELSKVCIVDTCQSAVYKLTGYHIPRSELDIALANSYSLNEFISIVQTATLSKCAISSVVDQPFLSRSYSYDVKPN